MPKAALHNLGCKVNAYEAEAMQQQLEEHGVTATVRRRLGRDIAAACGQLRRSTLSSGNDRETQVKHNENLAKN